MLKAIAFVVIFYFLIKFVSRFFLSSSNQKKSKAHAFYEIFKNVQQQSNSNKHQNNGDSSHSDNFEEIEEAEFEDVTNDDKSSTKSSD